MRRSRVLALAAVVLLAAAGGVWWWFERAGLPPPPKALAQSEVPAGFQALDPPLQMGGLAFQDAYGKTVRISDFRGRPVVRLRSCNLQLPVSQPFAHLFRQM